MNSPSQTSAPRVTALPLVLLIAAIVLRWMKLKGMVTLESLENFTPWMALAFTGTLLSPRRAAWFVWPLLLMLIDVAATGAKGITDPGTLAAYLCFATAAVIAGKLRGRVSLLGGMLGVLLSSLAFYIVTNTLAWVSMPEYAKTLAGWMQALTTGVPGYPETWQFLVRSLLSDTGFSLLLFAAYNSEASMRHCARIPLRATAA